MYLGAVAACMRRNHGNAAVERLMRRLDKEMLVGTLLLRPRDGFALLVSVLFGRGTGGSRLESSQESFLDDFGGFADWYIVQTTSPNFGGDYSNLSCFLGWATRSKPTPPNGMAWDCAAINLGRLKLIT